MQSLDPPKIQSFAVVNHKWLESSENEDTESLFKQVVCHINCLDNGNITMAASQNNTLKIRINTLADDIVKKIGLLQAAADLSGKFGSNTPGSSELSYIDTDQTRIIVGRFSTEYWFFCQFQFAKVHLNTGAVKYLQRGIASPEYLRRKFLDAYDLFVLNHGSLEYCETKHTRDEIKDMVTGWWKVWLDHTFELESAYNVSNDALFKLLPGVRYSCVDKPYGFTENVDIGMKEFIAEFENLQDVFVLSTNWIPEKNWGLVYLNEDSRYSNDSLHALINHLKDVDITFGLSTYALTYTNWPSLKKYVEQFKPEDPAGSLIERSLMIPAIYLQEKLANTVFDPIGEALDTFESYVPIMKTVNQVSDYVVPSLSAVSDLTMKPWHSLVSYWSGQPGNQNLEHDITAVAEPETSPQPTSPQLTSSESRAHSRKSGNEMIDESLEREESTGTYLLGLTKQSSMVTREYMLFDKIADQMVNANFVIYEINGIMFVLMFKESSQLKSELFYNELSTKLDSFYEKFFSDLILKQVEAIEAEYKEESQFSYIIYDDKKYWTTISNIPPNQDTLEYQIPQRKQLLEQNLKINLSKKGDTLDTYRTISLMQDKQLQYIIKDIAKNTMHPDFVADEKVSKIGKNQWCYFKRYSPTKWVIVVKQLDSIDPNNRRHFLGNKVQEWLDWVEASGYLC